MQAYQVPPSSIVALTFTNKAAREMQERVNALHSSTRPPSIGTFHSFCLRLLKMHRSFLGMEDFSIFDESDQEKCIQRLITEHGLHKQITPTSVLSTISHTKNHAVSGIANPLAIGQPLIRELFIAYEEEKKRSRCFDFDDLLLQAILLFKNPSFRKSYQETVRHLLVDEYQDTNHVQHALLRLLSTDELGTFCLDSLCVVGDEDQSIYSWRGATVENILSFPLDFPSTLSVTINQNYRSAQPILDAANYVISNNHRRVEKKLWSEKEGTDRVRILQTLSDRQEGEAVAAAAKTARRLNKHEHIAVLYRSHYQSRSIEEALIRASIPYTIIGGIKFYERQEIKDLLSYLRLVVNPYDRISFMRIFNTPTRGLGNQFEELFFDSWSNNPFLTFDLVAERLIESQAVTGKKAQSLKQFLTLFREVNLNDSPALTLTQLIQKTDYVSYLKDSFDEPIADEKIENIRELISAARAMEERGITTLGSFLDEVALIQEAGTKSKDSDDNPLVLMSMHAAKGLEFNFVILVGLEENVFPSSRSTIDDYLLEEERRLLYVGITRAQERLLITFANQRYTFGRICAQLPSRFLREIPSMIAPQTDGTSWSYYRFENFYQEWISGKKESKTTFWGSLVNDPFESEAAEHCTKKPSGNHVNQKSWKKYQTVHHKNFGTGVIKEVEERPAGPVRVTVLFACGTKKIDAAFLEEGETSKERPPSEII